MATQYTSLLGLALPVTGELSGSWGDTVNESITSLLDAAVAGTTTLSVDADVTLTTTTGAANQARQAVILWTASNGATTRNITAPAQSKPYIVINEGTGSIVLRGVGPTTGITIAANEKCLAAWDGSDFVKIASNSQTFSNVTLVSPTIENGYTEEIFAVSGTTPALSPANGSIQTWTLTGASTPTSGTWNAGQSITLMVDDGSAYSINWASLAVTWATDAGSPPTLNTSGFTTIALWKVGSTIYGARVGDA